MLLHVSIGNGNNPICLFIHHLIDLWVVSSWGRWQIKQLCTFMYKSLNGLLFAFLLNTCLGGEQDFTIRMKLIYWETAKLFSKEVVPFYIPTNKIEVLHLLIFSLKFDRVSILNSNSSGYRVLHYIFNSHYPKNKRSNHSSFLLLK